MKSVIVSAINLNHSVMCAHSGEKACYYCIIVSVEVFVVDFIIGFDYRVNKDWSRLHTHRICLGGGRLSSCVWILCKHLSLKVLLGNLLVLHLILSGLWVLITDFDCCRMVSCRKEVQRILLRCSIYQLYGIFVVSLIKNIQELDTSKFLLLAMLIQFFHVLLQWSYKDQSLLFWLLHYERLYFMASDHNV